MLFQMCYGPEIRSIYEIIRCEERQSILELKEKFQYSREGDITSLIDGALVLLKDLQYIGQENQVYFPVEQQWSVIEIFKKLRVISHQKEEESLNYVFSSLYEEIFVKPNRLFLVNLHHQINSKFQKTMVGREKVNAWKRLMEYFGLGRRVYSGFYALPHLEFLKEIISSVGPWEGGLHPFCEKMVHPIIPSITADGNVYKGLLFGLVALNDIGYIELSYKQDLPFRTYGSERQWNWIKVGSGSEKEMSL